MECKNCKNTLDQSDKFCNDCGAKIINHRITMGHLATEMKEGFFSIDSSKPARTFFHMFTKPDEVIDGYINGVRKKYIHAFGYFTLALTLSSFFFFVFLKWFPNILDFTINNANMGDNITQEQLDLQSKFTKGMFEYSSLMFFITIPLTALISRLVFLKNKKYNYAEHLIINLYSYSHISIVTTLLYFLTMWSQEVFTIISMSALFFQILFYCYVLKRLYKLSIGQIFLKLILFLFLLFVVSILILIAGGIFGYFMGAFDEIIDKAVKDAEAAKSVSYIASSVINWTS